MNSILSRSPLGILVLGLSCAAAGPAEAQQPLTYETVRQLYRPYARAATVWVNRVMDRNERAEARRGRALGEPITLGRCAIGDYDVTERRGSAEAEIHVPLTRLAVDLAWIREQLRRHNFPRSLYESTLNNYERAELRQIAIHRRGSMDLLAERNVIEILERNREAAYPSLPVLEAAPCPPPPQGATLAVLRSQPAGSTVWYLDELSADWCTASNIDPWDVQRCPDWGQSDSRQALPFYGWYLVQVRWQNGHVTRGRKEIYGRYSETRQYPVFTVEPR